MVGGEEGQSGTSRGEGWAWWSRTGTRPSPSCPSPSAPPWQLLGGSWPTPREGSLEQPARGQPWDLGTIQHSFFGTTFPPDAALYSTNIFSHVPYPVQNRSESPTAARPTPMFGKSESMFHSRRGADNPPTTSLHIRRTTADVQQNGETNTHTQQGDCALKPDNKTKNMH